MLIIIINKSVTMRGLIINTAEQKFKRFKSMIENEIFKENKFIQKLLQDLTFFAFFSPKITPKP